jgi:glycopeptide antibiotics resistance protein
MEQGRYMNDKMLHIAGSVVPGFLFPEAFPDFPVARVFIAWISISTGFEVFQQWATNGHRQFDLRDIGMNLAGFGLAYLIGQLILPSLRKYNLRISQTYHSKTVTE